MTRQQKVVDALFAKLMQAPLHEFPEPRQRLNAPDRQGVYMICGPRGRVLYVGRTLRGRGGIARRLRRHLAGRSSFVNGYLGGNDSWVRDNCRFRYLVVRSPRRRALLEAYAIGHLCPAHLGLGSGTSQE